MAKKTEKKVKGTLVKVSPEKAREQAQKLVAKLKGQAESSGNG